MAPAVPPAAPRPMAGVGRHAVDAAALARLADAGVLAALVDACDAPEVPGRVLDRFPDGGACLYQGADALAFRDRAPYLVRVDRALLAWLTAPGAEGGLADTPWGVFVVSDAPFAALVRHWRGWLQVTPPDGGEPWTFRFYDPRLAPVFLDACTPAEAAAFFGPARSLVVPAWEGGTDAGAPAGAGPAGWMLTPAVLSYAEQTGGARRGVGERFRVRDAHLAAFRRRAFGDALVASFEREAPATGQRAWRDPADPAAGDVLLSGCAAAAPRGAPNDTPDGAPVAVPPARIAFDARGFVGAVTSPLGRTWRTESDGDGRPLRLTTPAGVALAFGYGAGGEVERATRGLPGAERLLFTAEHDAAGRLTRRVFADGTAASTAYLHEGDAGVLDRHAQRPREATDRLGRTTRYGYDAEGRLASITDALGRETRFAYAGWQRPLAVSFPGGRRERYAYDAEGHLAGVTYADGATLRVTCDDAGRVTALVGLAAFDRDAAGRVLDASTPRTPNAPPTAVHFAYDEASGRVLSEAATAGPVDPLGTPGGAPGAAPLRTAVEYAYDAQGTLVGFAHPTGERIAYGRDADGRLTSVTDWAGRAYAVAYDADEGGWRLTTPEGLVVAVTQSPEGLPVAVAATRADGTALFRTALAYDAEDRVAEVNDSRLGAWRYAHDAEGQLVASDGPTAAESARYAYDAAGNRVRAEPGPGHALDEWRTTCDVDAGDRLLRQGAQRLAYDACGRVSARADDGGLGPNGRWRYAYDARGQLTRAWGRGADGAERALAFAYDAFGRRVWKLALDRAAGAARVAARRTRFVWAGEQCVREVAERAAWDAPPAAGGDPAGNPFDGPVPAGTAWADAEARDYLYWPGTSTPLLLRVTRAAEPGAEASAPATYLYHTDQVGAPVRLTDAAGRVVWEAAYAPFGAARLTVAEVAQPWRRPGQYADDEAGLCYNRLRYYDPCLGRYLTPDPAGLLGGTNPYRYAGNGPTWDADPLGLWPSWGTIAAVAAAAVVAVAVVALAPIALPLAIVAAGVAAGATYGFLNEGLNNGFNCLSCLAGATAKGAVVGGLAALPFAFLPATAGVAAFVGAGAGSGAIGYTADWAVNGADPSKWSWGAFAGSTAFGAVTAGGGRYLGPRVANWWRGRGSTPAPAPRPAPPPAPRALPAPPPRLALPPARPTTNTLAQIRRMPQPAKWQAGERYVRELYGAGPERHYPVPPGTVAGRPVTGTGGRYVDAPIDLPRGGVVAGEVKTYGQWRTVSGVAQRNEVPLSDHIQQQILKDVWLRNNVPGYEPRWMFLDAPPSQELTNELARHGIISVIYH